MSLFFRFKIDYYFSMNKRNIPLYILFVLLVIALGVGLFANLFMTQEEVAIEETPTPTPIPTPEVYHASLLVGGDALLHGAVYVDAAVGDGTYDFHEQVSLLKPWVSKYDLAYYNQETMLGGTELGLSTYPTFNSPQEFGDAMVDLGFNMVSTANNHSLDVWEEGIIRSKEYWKKQEGVVEAGTNLSFEEQEAIPVYECNGITYAFMAYTYGLNGLIPPEGKEYLVNVYPGQEEKVLERIRQAKEKADVVIMAMHWGIEYSMEPSEEQITFAEQMAEAGADIIIGNHPHVIQPVEWIGDTICFYAMGNLISAQEGIERLIGMIGGLDITKTVENGETTIKIENVRADLIYTYYDYAIRNFKVYPFESLDDSILPGYQDIYQEYIQIITERDNTIQVGGI